MNVQISTAHNEARLAGTLAFLAAGTGTAKVQIFGTEQPAFGGTAGAAPLAEIALQQPEGAVLSGVLSLLPADDGLILTTGPAVWARVLNRNGSIALDCDVSDNTGNGFLKLSQLNLYAGGVVRITSSALT